MSHWKLSTRIVLHSIAKYWEVLSPIHITTGKVKKVKKFTYIHAKNILYTYIHTYRCLDDVHLAEDQLYDIDLREKFVGKTLPLTSGTRDTSCITWLIWPYPNSQGTMPQESWNSQVLGLHFYILSLSDLGHDHLRHFLKSSFKKIIFSITKHRSIDILRTKEVSTKTVNIMTLMIGVAI